MSSRSLTLLVFAVVCAGVAHDAPVRAADPRSPEGILAETGVQGGFVVHLGCGDGKLTAAFPTKRFQIHGLDRDATNVKAAREHVQSLGKYGAISVDQLRGDRLPYVDNIVNLLVAENLNGASQDEVMRVLAPRGVAYVRQGGAWTKTVKPVPENIDDWTHFMHDAGGNAVAHDTAVGPPRHLQWLGSPRWSRHHDRMASMSAMVSAKGRVFYIMDEGSRISVQMPSKWMLIARDAFNGVVLWKRPIGEWHSHLWPLKSGPTQLARRLVAVDDRVFVTLGINAPLSMLDAAAGETIRTFDDTGAAEEVLVSDGKVFVLARKGKSELADYAPEHNVGDQGRVGREFAWKNEGRVVTAFDPETGKPLWTSPTGVLPLTLSANGDGVYFHDGERVICLDRKSGSEIWRTEEVGRRGVLPFNFGPKLVVHDGVVLFAGGDRSMGAFDAKSGKQLWKSQHERGGYQSPEDLLVVRGMVWSAPTTSGRDSGVWTGRDLKTGEVKVEFPPNVDTYWFHHRCYITKATDRFLMPSRTGIEFVDHEKKDWMIHHWVRGGCLYGIMPANGLIYAPPHNCACYPEAKLSGLNVLAPASASRRLPERIAGDDRLERGPAFDEAIAAEASRHDDWPTYRGDNARSGATSAGVSAELEPSWQTELGGRLTAVVVAGGSLYVAQVDQHTLHALDADDGAKQWSFTAGGRIDSPPTIAEGCVVFGSVDGWIYCLRASDGHLIWKFRAAPRDERLMAMEQLESVWPVHGSVLVQDGQVHATAGRSAFLDGGMRLVKLDLATGELLKETVMDDRDPATGENLQARIKVLQMPVGLPDILSSDGKYVYMRSQAFDADGTRVSLGPHSADFATQGSVQRGPTAHLFAPMGFLDGTYFHRAYWVYGRSFAGGHAGYFQAGKYAPSGRLLVHDDQNVYGFARKPEYYRWTTTLEHWLYSASKEPPPQAVEAAPAAGGGKPAGRAAKSGMIRVAKSASLDPTGKPLAVAAWVKAAKGGGVVLARGGPARGYALWIRGGRPQFVVREGEEKTVSAIGKQKITGKWTHLVGLFTSDRHVQLYVNGKLASDGGTIDFISSDPAQALEVGGDEGGPVGDYQSPNVFNGIIDEVRVYRGAVSADEVAALAAVDNTRRLKIADAQLVLRMSFDDGKPADDSGRGNHGTNDGAQVADGRHGKAMQFIARRRKGVGGRPSGVFVDYHWTRDVPLLVRAMAKAGDKLIIAGPPDLVDEEQSFQRLVARDPKVQARLHAQDAALRGEQGGRLHVVDARSGETLATYETESLPVWDGLAAAAGRIYLTTENGQVVCYAGNSR